MNKYIKTGIIALLLVNTGCAYRAFDGTLYDKVVSVKLISDNAKEYCKHGMIPNFDIILLKSQTEYLTYYTEYRVGHSEIHQSLNLLQDMTRKLNPNMSTTYCGAKMENISKASDSIVRTLGAL